ncbi:MAG: cell division protein FtsQ/DivIB [Planctomycetota bacterium]
MAKRRRKRRKTKRISFRAGISRKKRRKAAYRPSLAGILKVLVVLFVLAAIVVGFVFLKRAIPFSQKTLTPKLVKPPVWVTKQLKEEIYAAAKADGEDLRLDENVARSVQNNLDGKVAWLDEVRVRVANDQLLIEARWRKPVALVKRGLNKFYVDAGMVVLDYVPMPDLPVVEVKGLSVLPKPPSPGEVLQKDDLAAAVAILAILDRRDRLLQSRGLLYEIDRIDVSNFNGRENRRAPHIVLYAKDTEIKWGAELGKWQQHFESTDAQKIAKLYEHYKEHGTLLSGVKYINLCDPRDDIALPVDKY